MNPRKRFMAEPITNRMNPVDEAILESFRPVIRLPGPERQ